MGRRSGCGGVEVPRSRSAAGDELTEYHVEAGIAALHTGAGSAEKTRWSEIVALYDTLMKIRPSPVVALNRAIALAESGE
jgi:predicted RNA polymerase sigma factor